MDSDRRPEPALPAPRAGRVTLREVAGGLGDIGTLFPIAVGLIAVNGLSPTAVLVLAGGFYIWSGWFYGVPVPVQPLKSLGVAAIALHLPASTVVAGALLIGAVEAGLGLTGLATRVADLFTRPLVRGIQLGLAFLLVRAALPPVAGDLLLAGAAACLLLLLRRSRRLPSAIALVLLGIALIALRSPLPPPAIGPSPLAPGLPSSSDLLPALTLLAIPQLPLTFANSVAATRDTARAYFGPRARRVTARALTLDMGLANIVAGLLGGMPMCHGAGGMTAHYRFGARSGASLLMFGGALAVLGLLLGNAASGLSLFPGAVLGVMLLYIGATHALLARDLRGSGEWLVALAVALGTALTSNLAAGLVAGALAEGGRRFRKR